MKGSIQWESTGSVQVATVKGRKTLTGEVRYRRDLDPPEWRWEVRKTPTKRRGSVLVSSGSTDTSVVARILVERHLKEAM